MLCFFSLLTAPLVGLCSLTISVRLCTYRDGMLSSIPTWGMHVYVAPLARLLLVNAGLGFDTCMID